MSTKTAQQIWETALGELQVQVSPSNYRTWLEKTSGLGYENDEFIINVPSTFVAEYLQQNQRSLIEKALINLTSPQVQVVFQVNGGRRHEYHVQTGAASLPAAIPAGTAKWLNPGYSFDNFIEGDCNRLARSAALAIAEKPGQNYNPLFIYGGVGLGKTHLLQAIGNAAAAKNTPAVCVSAERFTNEFVAALRGQRTEEFRGKYRNTGMLLIDDIQFISGKEQTEESFFHTFNELHNGNRQIVLTCDRSPQEIPELAERLRSRFNWGLIVDIQPPDYATRLAILRDKAGQRGVALGETVLEYIAGQDQPNIRELEGALNRVIAYSHLLHGIPTIDLAAEALRNIADRQPGRQPMLSANIISRVAQRFQLTAKDLTGQRRDKEAVTGRRIAMYLLRQETNHPLAKIGTALGGRDAAAVTNACKRVARELATDARLKQIVGEISQNIHKNPAK